MPARLSGRGARIGQIAYRTPVVWRGRHFLEDLQEADVRVEEVVVDRVDHVVRVLVIVHRKSVQSESVKIVLCLLWYLDTGVGLVGKKY